MNTESKTIDRNDPKSAAEFNDIANNIFAPIYPIITEQVITRCAIHEGACVELGCGPALLAIAMAKMTDFNFIALDHSPPMVNFAKNHIKKENLSQRILPIVGDVHRLPFPNNCIDLMISRGSMGFWQDKPAAFREIQRVLKKDAKAYVGCGMGSSELRNEIFEKMRKIDKNWNTNHKDRNNKLDPDEFESALKQCGFKHFEILQNDSGFWVYIES